VFTSPGRPAFRYLRSHGDIPSEAADETWVGKTAIEQTLDFRPINRCLGNDRKYKAMVTTEG